MWNSIGDAAPHSEVDSLLTVSMRSMCSTVSVGHSQFVLFTVPKSIITKKMMEDIWKVIVGSLTTLAKQKKGIVYSITGDLEFYYTEYGFPRFNVANPCPFCECDQ